ncbi:methyltransferase domain-containing protein [Nocardioides sp. SR21]|uniref:methyltransferase domain-containing protein n=1 Tax=Nocardioides sp. SR21 TaxID=2919501 RepID=UPI001FAB15F2|nr:methyltransferase domain-containing protein [Nocardioides sp. SR21]
MFFDDHPEFKETSNTASTTVRLNWRHHAMIESNSDLLVGARVLDIASHDGRWSMAALEAGAEQVVGVEGRPEFVERAYENLRKNGVPDDRYRFIGGDIFDVLAGPDEHELGRFDVVLCLGFVYHTLRYSELLGGIRGLGPRHVVVDTKVTVTDSKVIFLGVDRVDVEGQAVESDQAYNNLMLVGHPSPSALATMLDVYDFDVVRRFPWATLIEEHPSLKRRRAMGAYRSGGRVTWVAENRNVDGTSPQDPAVIRARRRRHLRRIRAAEEPAAP